MDDNHSGTSHWIMRRMKGVRNSAVLVQNIHNSDLNFELI